MSRVQYTLSRTILVFDGCHLPKGVHQDDVYDKVSEVIDDALHTWYEKEGKEFLVCEPI